MNEQSASSVGGASNGADFQPPTQNPQSNVNSTLQQTGSNIQSPAGNILNGNTTILVPTASGNVSVAPNHEVLGVNDSPGINVPPASVRSPLIVWIGIGSVLVLLGVMAIGLLRPRKY